MKILLSNAGKRYNREWIFRRASLEFESGKAYAITGSNGSGKSTLLQSIGGMLQVSEGSVTYHPSNNITGSNGQISAEEAYKHISLSAPYLDIIEEMTLVEFLQFHTQFKNFISGLQLNTVIEKIGLKAAANKQIRYYSSGMKQRVRLAQAIFSDSEILLLDEPCSNLDAAGIALYHSLINEFCKNKLIIVSSNDEVEYNFCNEVISMSTFK